MRLPLNPPVRITPHGAFGYVRRTAAEGGCGTKKHPCTHNGVDLAAPKGTRVYAPEHGRIVVAAYDNSTPPLRGFGPGAVKFLGDSGAVHTLGHLDPAWWQETTWQWPGSIFEGIRGQPRMPSEGRVYAEGELLGVIAKDHVHWEVVINRGPGKSLKIDPMAWVRGAAGGGGGTARSGSGLLLLLVLAAMASSRRKR